MDDARNHQPAETGPRRVPCPDCGEMISEYATVCRWCDTDLREDRYKFHADPWTGAPAGDAPDPSRDEPALRAPAPQTHVHVVAYASLPARTAAMCVDIALWLLVLFTTYFSALVFYLGDTLFSQADMNLATAMEQAEKLSRDPVVQYIVLGTVFGSMGFMILLETMMLAVWGTSPGKALLGLVVVRDDGLFRRPPPARAFLRTSFKWFLVCPGATFCPLLVLPATALLVSRWHRRRQALDDMVAGTLVIKRPPGWTAKSAGG